MANLPISGLPTASALDGTELLPFVQGGVTTQANVQDILDANLPITSSGIILSGPIVPSIPSGSSLGTAQFPFGDLYVSSGSINIASDILGDPNTSLSNEGGNILVSAGGMRLVEPGNSFIAETGSFQYITGSINQVGNYTMQGNKIITGSLSVNGLYKLSTSYIDGNISASVDLTKQVLVMNDGTWILPDGVEGQIIYFTLDNGGSAEDCYLTVHHLRYNNNGLGTQVISGSWSPFQYGSGQPDFAICTAIFTDGYWAFSGGRLR
jgi:hypothetical protein